MECSTTHAQNQAMASYWILAVVGVLVVAGLVVLLARRGRQRPVAQETDIPLWDAEEHPQRDFWPELQKQSDETMPAVLTPEAWKTPKSANGRDE